VCMVLRLSCLYRQGPQTGPSGWLARQLAVHTRGSVSRVCIDKAPRLVHLAGCKTLLESAVHAWGTACRDVSTIRHCS